MTTTTARAGHPVFDFHARLTPRPGAMEGLLTAMDAAGVERAAVSPGGVTDPDTLATQVMVGGHVENSARNTELAAECHRSGGRLVPFFFANPHSTPEEYQRHAGEFSGMELSPAVHGVDLTDDRTLAFVETARAARHPVYVVCIGRPGQGPADLVALAKAFPDVVFVLGHCGFVGIDLYSINLITAHTNILAETSGCYTHVARAAVERLGAERVLFGTEYPLQHPDVELAKLRALGLDAEQSALVSWRNAHHVLRETPR